MPAQSGNNLSISQIRDGLINPNFTTPLYASATSFTVSGDVTSWLRPGREVILTFQTSGVKRCIITSLSYDSGTSKTTINTTGRMLVNETITSVLLSASDLPLPIDPTGPVLYLPFEEGTGTTTEDLSGWNNHGTLVNGPTWTTGKKGKCLSFDGVDDYVNCGNSVSLKSNTLSVEFWAKPNTMNNYQRWLGKNLYNGTKMGWMVIRTNSNACMMSLHDANNVEKNSVFVPYNINEWAHFAFTYEYPYIKAYKNGTHITPDTNVSGWTFAPSDELLTVGKAQGHPSYFNGLIGEVRIYNRALTEAEIQNHYQNP